MFETRNGGLIIFYVRVEYDTFSTITTVSKILFNTIEFSPTERKFRNIE